MNRAVSMNVRNGFAVPMVVSSPQAWGEMEHMTNRFDPAHGLTREFVDTLYRNVFNREGLVFRGILYAPREVSTVKKVIGKGGCYFTMTTANTNCMFIWHDREYNAFVFYGRDIDCVYRAMEAIQKRIDTVTYKEELERVTLDDSQFTWL